MKSIRIICAALSVLAAMVSTPREAGATASSTAAAEPTLSTCSWDRPGHNPFMGDVVAAVDRYRDIDPTTRERLKARMAKRDYDDIVSINRDGISGRSTYAPSIRDMYFGNNQICRNVTRSAWSPDMHERGLVYCEGRECILVPTVCRNVSRVSRAQVMGETVTDPDGDAVADPLIATAPPSVPGTGPGVLDERAVPLGLSHPSSFASLGAPFAGAFFPPVVGGSGGSDAASSPASGAPPGEGGTPFPGGTVPGGGGAVTPVPEPSTWLLLAGGFLAVLVGQRRRAGARG